MKIFIIAVALFSSHLWSRTGDRIGEYPPSRRYAPIVKTIDHHLFKQIIKEIKSIYITEDNLKQIKIESNWENSFTVAYSSHRDNKWIIYVNGGMARATSMTPDAFRLLLCHEMGHLIGGAPFASENRWAAVEGQADYFASSKCMKRVLEHKDNTTFLQTHPAPLEIQAKCQQSYANINQQEICIRTSLAGEALISAFAYMLNKPNPSLLDHDSSVVNRTIIDDYPSIQCRLDTIIAGATCDIDPVGITSSTSAHQNGCTAQNGDRIGLRPACWFNESEFY
jgi:hypothetical protein